MKQSAITILLLSIFTGLGLGTPNNIHAQDMALNIGDKAPEFEALSADGDLWRSADHVGESILVVYFYPAAGDSEAVIAAIEELALR